MKITLIGSGNIGGVLAFLFAKDPSNNVILYDINENTAKAKALDIGHCLFSNILPTQDFNDTKGSDIIIITAGVARKAGMSREDLLSINGKIMQDIGTKIGETSKNAFVIVVTNPLDIMSYVILKSSKLPEQKVVGMAGELDRARFCFFISKHLGVLPSQVNAMVLGGHGDFMVPIIDSITVGNLPISHYINCGKITMNDIEKIVKRTQLAGGEIVDLSGTSAYYSPAMSAYKMSMSYKNNDSSIIVASTMCNGEYGIDHFFMGIPVIINNSGVSEKIEIKLIETEKQIFEKSKALVQKTLKEVKELLSM